jgi:hypothetical protein
VCGAVRPYWCVKSDQERSRERRYTHRCYCSHRHLLNSSQLQQQLARATQKHRYLPTSTHHHTDTHTHLQHRGEKERGNRVSTKSPQREEDHDSSPHTQPRTPKDHQQREKRHHNTPPCAMKKKDTENTHTHNTTLRGMRTTTKPPPRDEQILRGRTRTGKCDGEEAERRVNAESGWIRVHT